MPSGVFGASVRTKKSHGRVFFFAPRVPECLMRQITSPDNVPSKKKTLPEAFFCSACSGVSVRRMALQTGEKTRRTKNTRNKKTRGAKKKPSYHLTRLDGLERSLEPHPAQTLHPPGLDKCKKPIRGQERDQSSGNPKPVKGFRRGWSASGGGLLQVGVRAWVLLAQHTQSSFHFNFLHPNITI